LLILIFMAECERVYMQWWPPRSKHRENFYQVETTIAELAAFYGAEDSEGHYPELRVLIKGWILGRLLLCPALAVLKLTISSFLQGDEFYHSGREYSTDISRHLPAPKIDAVSVRPASSPAIDVLVRFKA
jgi:hypothetical protein